MFNNVKKLVVASAAASVLSMGMVGAQAATIGNFLFGGQNSIEDTDFDRVLRCTTGQCTSLSQYSTVVTGDFQVGDILQAVVRFEKINVFGGGDMGMYRLFGYSELEVVSNAGGTLTFGASDFLGGGLANGSMISLFEQDPTALAGATFATQSAQTTINAILAMSPVVALGLSDADDYWRATVTSVTGSQIGDLAALGNNTGPLVNQISAAGTLGLSVIANPYGLGIVKNGTLAATTASFHDVVGSVSAFTKSTGTNSDWLIETDTKAFFRIPEPDSVALLGAVLIGGAGVTRFRRSKTSKV